MLIKAMLVSALRYEYVSTCNGAQRSEICLHLVRRVPRK